MTIQIRIATKFDIALLAALIRDSFRDVAERFNLTSDNCPTHPSNCEDEWIEAAFNKGIKYFILEDDNTPCGCVALEMAQPGLCYLERLAVLPRHRGNGYGKILVKYIIKKAKEIEVNRIEIGIIAKSKKLKDWYIRLGFTIKNSVHFDHLPFDVTFMYKPIE